MKLVKAKDLFGNLRIVMTTTNGAEYVMDNFVVRDNPDAYDGYLNLNNLFYNRLLVDVSTYAIVASDVVITGDPECKIDGCIIGVIGGCICQNARIAFIDDPLGTYCNYIKSQKSLPVGAFKIDTSNRLIDLWSKKNSTCSYLPLENKNFIASKICGSTRTKLYQFNTTVAAMHFAAKYLKCQSITLDKCSFLESECRDGFLKYKDMYLHPADEVNVLSVEAAVEMCKDAGIDIYIK